jgi:hypothetical protein
MIRLDPNASLIGPFAVLLAWCGVLWACGPQ